MLDVPGEMIVVCVVESQGAVLTEQEIERPGRVNPKRDIWMACKEIHDWGRVDCVGK